MEENNEIKSILEENNRLASANIKLSSKLNIALQGLMELYSEPRGVAKTTLEEIQNIDKNLPQEE